MTERWEVLNEKDELVQTVIAAVRREKGPSEGDEALYKVFKSSEWKDSGKKSIRDVDFSAAAYELNRYLKPEIYQPWMKHA